MSICSVLCFFFFSSRRRHTRYIGDWSSDVCSSDLSEALRFPSPEENAARDIPVNGPFGLAFDGRGSLLVANTGDRSEERRVGKECRSRWGAEHCSTTRDVHSRGTWLQRHLARLRLD